MGWRRGCACAFTPKGCGEGKDDSEQVEVTLSLLLALMSASVLMVRSMCVEECDRGREREGEGDLPEFSAKKGVRWTRERAAGLEGVGEGGGRGDIEMDDGRISDAAHTKRGTRFSLFLFVRLLDDDDEGERKIVESGKSLLPHMIR